MPYYELKFIARKALKGRLIKPALIFLFTTLLTVFTNILALFVGDMELLYAIIIQALILIFISDPFRMGATVFLMKFLNNENPSVGVIFDGYKYIFKTIWYSILNFVVSALYTLFLNYILSLKNISSAFYILFTAVTVIVLILQLYLAFTFYIIYDNKDKSGIFAIIRSIKMLHKHIIYLIGLYFSFIGWIFLSFLTYGIVLLYVSPYMETTILMFYYSLKLEKNKEEEKNEREEE